MLQDVIVLVTKDAMRCDYLPVYGNTYWKTPNITALAEKGTVFSRHYTNAPSTSMAVTCMFSGLNAHELERRYYSEVEKFTQKETVFDVLEKQGYSTHVFWTEDDYGSTYPYSKCYGEKAVFHNVGNAPADMEKEIDALTGSKLFLWIHLPAVLTGFVSWESDVEETDRFVGFLRKKFGDDGIYISADHAQMKLGKGIPGYGFHVYDAAIRVPFISPRIMNLPKIDFPTSHRQFPDIVLQGEVTPQQYVFSDTQYYLQAHRRLGIIKGKYKYIFNKYFDSEELYDLDRDPGEEVNLLNLLKNKLVFDPFRLRSFPFTTIYYYPFLDDASKVYEELKAVKNEVWRQGKWHQELPRRLKARYKSVKYGILAMVRKNIVKSPK